MKVFEEWLKKQEPYDPYCCADMSKAAWKSALEWVLSWERDQESIEIIERELGNKSIIPPSD